MLLQRLDGVLAGLPDLAVEVVLVDDGSRDRTAEIIQAKAEADQRYQAVLLSRNFGHQLAVSAGMSLARGTEGLFIIDGDLQDPPELLPEFHKHLKNGYDVIYGVRRRRKESLAKIGAYGLFYRILERISYIEMPLDSGDFSMISRRVADVMNAMPEESRYLRGMRAWIGFKQIGVEYDRHERAAGEPKYTLKALMKLASAGIFNFSELPVRVATYMGVTAIVSAVIYLMVTIYKKFFLGDVPSGFTALLFVIILFSGINLVCLGVLGEYVLRSFFQLKQRPLFIVRRRVVEGVADDRAALGFNRRETA
jgi:dolichol-phosphate mannosyltransferase